MLRFRMQSRHQRICKNSPTCFEMEKKSASKILASYKAIIAPYLYHQQAMAQHPENLQKYNRSLLVQVYWEHGSTSTQINTVNKAGKKKEIKNSMNSHRNRKMNNPEHLQKVRATLHWVTAEEKSAFTFRFSLGFALFGPRLMSFHSVLFEFCRDNK